MVILSKADLCDDVNKYIAEVKNERRWQLYQRLYDENFKANRMKAGYAFGLSVKKFTVILKRYAGIT